jgi:hypothetical protein
MNVTCSSMIFHDRRIKIYLGGGGRQMETRTKLQNVGINKGEGCTMFRKSMVKPLTYRLSVPRDVLLLLPSPTLNICQATSN